MRNLRISQSILDRRDNSLKIFFKDIAKIPRITIEEEVELSKRIKEGDKKALNKLVESNLRFVISVAKQYQNKGLPLVDLIQYGVIGMVEAAQRWDASRGFKFITYAVWWIRQSIIQAISSECRTIRVPINQITRMSKLVKATEKLEQELGRDPSTEELAEATKLDADKVHLTLTSISQSISLDTPFKDNESTSILDTIPDTNSGEVDESITTNSLYTEIEKVLRNLSDREGDIIRMTFGIGMAPMQNEEVASRFGIGCERVRQIQHEAIEKIKLNYKDVLRDLL